MTANDPLKVSPQQILEGRSLPGISAALSPWLIQWAQQGSDFGRDGLVQVVDQVGVGGVVSPLTFLIQAKSQQQALSQSATISVETRHLANWIRSPSTVLLALWGSADQNTAFRTARQAAAELNRVKPAWREQDTVTFHFRSENILEGSAARECIRRWVADEADSLGGLKRFHQARRRVLLTDLYHGTASTSDTITAAAPGLPDERLILGPAWQDRDLDPVDVFAPRVLSGALLLFEEVLVPLTFLGVSLRDLGPDLLLSLLESEHLVPVTTESLLAFRHTEGELRGRPVAIHPLHHDGPFVGEVAKRLAPAAALTPGLIDAIVRATRVIPESVSIRVVKESEGDLAKPAVRALLGLSPYRTSDTSEPVWDAPFVNRLLHLNIALATAEELALDVVEYEAGLSRLAAEKWYTELRFNRLFASVESFDAVLRGAGVPDLGLLETVLGLGPIARLSMNEEAQSFRDWFWEWVYGLTEVGPNVEASVISRLQTMVGQDIRSIRLPSALKLRFFDELRADYVVGPSEGSRRYGYAARSERGATALQRQAALQTKRRLQAIGSRFGELAPYVPCPCGSDAKFRFCCGVRR